MKQIKLKQLFIRNFKGISELNINFGDITNISGANALGKSSVFDAFTWLLFDKNSKGDSKFEIKPLDENNNYIRGLNPTVTGVLEVDGIEIKLAKQYKEKWTSKRGESEKIFDGNTTKYEVNDVPVKKSDYVKEIEAIAGEDVFKLLTNPYYFPTLNWKDQRKTILDVVGGDVKVEEVIKLNPDLKVIQSDLQREDASKLIESKKGTIKKLRENKRAIPYKIEELMETIVDNDVSDIQKEIEAKEQQVKDIDIQIADISKSNKEYLENRSKLLNKISDNEKAIQDEQNLTEKLYNEEIKEIQKKISEKEKDKCIKQNKLFENQCKVEGLTNKFNMIQKEVDDLRNLWGQIQKKNVDFSNIKTECPTCKRPFDEEDLEEKREEMEKNFNLDKAKRLKEVAAKGKEGSKELEEIKEDIENLTLTNSDIETQINLINEEISKLDKDIWSKKTPELSEESKEKILKLKRENNKLKEQLDEGTTIDTSKLLDQKGLINQELKSLYSNLGSIENNKKVQKRIDELQAEEKEIGVEIAQNEKLVMLYEKFITKRVELLETSINKKFKNVSFKLFETQVNGGINETCEALISGVPFRNANTASQINAGIDIINTLSEYVGYSVPIFIDNAECVNEIAASKGQLVRLVVTDDKKLKIDAIEVATEEDIIYFEEQIEKIKEELSCYSKGIDLDDVIGTYLPDAKYVDEEIGEQHRWWTYKTRIYQWKNFKIYGTWQDPATEMQEGQETDMSITTVRI